MQTAMATTLFHWTLHPWAIYAVVGLAIAYGVYRKGRLQLISAAFEPLHRRPGRTGRWARSSTCWRSSPRCSARPPRSASARCRSAAACSIVGGLGTTGNAVLVGIIAVLTVAFIFSAVSGVAKGIQWLSNINMVLALTPGGLRLRRRPDGLHPQPDPDVARQLPAGPGDDVGPHRRRGRRRGRRPGCRAGRSSTGPGGSRGRRSSACSSRASRAAAPSGSSSPACCWCRAWSS